MRLPWRKSKDAEWQERVNKAVDELDGNLGPEVWTRRLEKYKWECKHRPDYTKLPEVEEELERAKDPFAFALKKMSPEDREEALKIKAEHEKSFIHKFEKRALELEKKRIERAMERNDTPARKEDKKFWRSLPPIMGPDGLPLVRKALSGENEATARILDFFKQHLFGLWGYRQRPYPPEYPIDVQQALGYKFLEKRYIDWTMRAGKWYYKDRLGRTRGPMELVNMQTAWCHGIIDKNTFVWGDDMDEWVPIGMLFGLQHCIERLDVRLTTQGVAAIFKLTHGVPLTAPKKGHERKSMKQLQQEAIEKRDRENAVLRLNGGIWPSEREPSHAMFLWAAGSQLTDLMKGFKPGVPDKFISAEQRKKLVKLCPGLRPKDFICLEQIMDALTYQADWYREPLGTFTTKPDFEAEYFKDLKESYDYTIEEVEHFFNSIEGAPKVIFPRTSGQKFIMREKLPDE